MVAQLLQLLFCAFLLLKPTEALATRGVFGLQHAPHRSLGVARARSSLPLKSVVECKDEACNFVEEVVTASKDTFVIVDFYADWCGPCKIAAKTFGAIASEFPDKSVKFVKVNTENHEMVVDDYGLKGLPVFGIFKNGQLVKKHEGNIGKEKLLDWISQGIQDHR